MQYAPITSIHLTTKVICDIIITKLPQCFILQHVNLFMKFLYLNFIVLSAIKMMRFLE